MTIAETSDASSGKKPTPRGPLDPRGRMHVPIGLANTLDSLKTFVEAEGPFSPGVGSYGVYFWLLDRSDGKLTAATMDGVRCEHGLAPGGYLIPWSKWSAGGVEVRTEVCQVRRDSPKGPVMIVAARATLTNTGTAAAAAKKVRLYVALRALGPAGFAVDKLAVSDAGDALLVDGHPAIVAGGPQKPTAAGVLATDTIGEAAMAGKVPNGKAAQSQRGDCSGALCFDLDLAPGQAGTVGLICPVLPGRRAVGHQWDGTSTWAQLDLARPNPALGGVLQPDPGLDYYRGLGVQAAFDDARRYWQEFVGTVKLRLPDPRWAEAFAAIAAHVALAMNEGAPDVAVVNYNVFNRDGVYVANILQKSGRFDLAADAIGYFLAHPFNGRVYPEADNPGQILWCMGEHWRFTQDRTWLKRVYPAARKIAAMIEYYRTTPAPHWVRVDGLEFGESLPTDKRQKLEPGRCDGQHPEYTEAFDVAGLRAAAMLAQAAGNADDASAFSRLAETLFEQYDRRFGKQLAKGYGSYAVLWPCRLYPPGQGPAHEQFKGVGASAKRPDGWRYFPLATAHQGLLAGRREAGLGTIRLHLDHPQMRGWYVFDEGGGSGPGGWRHLRTTWDPGVAMPHGWALAELHLLLRDSMAFEDAGRLVLFGGVPAEWFTNPGGMSIEGLPTHFGALSAAWTLAEGGAKLTLTGPAAPPEGFALRLPPGLATKVTADGKAIDAASGGDYVLREGTKEVSVQFAK